MTPSAADPGVRVVLLAGGKGTRFWPASRVSRPKQFLRLLEDRTLLRLTFDRFARLVPADRIHVVSSAEHAGRIREDLAELPAGNLLLEPSGKDTAPAAAFAARELRGHGDETVLVVAPTDHYVRDEAAFEAAIRVGIAQARLGSLVTFGVVPDRPATGYGYLEVRSGAAGSSGGVREVLRFREKPDAAEAERFLAAGSFYWNAGIFVWTIGSFERELAAASPDLATGIASLPTAGDPGSAAFSALGAAWEALPSRSIDYALMEKSSRVVCVPLAAGWSDVGGWDVVRSLSPVDEAGNRPVEDVLYVGTRNSAVYREGSGTLHPRLYALVGVEGIVVVETDGAVLICREGAGEEVRDVVRRLREGHREDLV